MPCHIRVGDDYQAILPTLGSTPSHDRGDTVIIYDCVRRLPGQWCTRAATRQALVSISCAQALAACSASWFNDDEISVEWEFEKADDDVSVEADPRETFAMTPPPSKIGRCRVFGGGVLRGWDSIRGKSKT